MSVDTLKQWSVAIDRVTFTDWFDCDEIVRELLMDRTEGFQPDTDDADCCITERTPLTQRLRDDVVIPSVVAYVRRHFHVDINADHLVTRSWFRDVCEPGHPLPSHFHRLSHISTICYLGGVDGDVYFTDPLSQQTLAYPPLFRDAHYGGFRHTPQPGELLIFPSFLYHQIGNVAHPPRFCMPSDYLVKAVG